MIRKRLWRLLHKPPYAFLTAIGWAVAVAAALMLPFWPGLLLFAGALTACLYFLQAGITYEQRRREQQARIYALERELERMERRDGWSI